MDTTRVADYLRRVVVFGGKGFVGSAVVKQLVNSDHEVYCVEPKISPGRLAEVADRVTMIEGDVRDFEGVCHVVEDCKATSVLTVPFYRGRSLFEEMSVMATGTWNVFEAARLAGVKRVAFASSIRVYGPQSAHGEVALGEESPLFPVDRYGVYKRLAEVLAESYNRYHQMEIACLRLPAVYGPGIREGAAGVAQAIVQAVENSHIDLPYRPEAKQCLAHVDDCAAAFMALLGADFLRHTVYELGGMETSYREMAEVAVSLVPGVIAEFSPQEKAPELTFAHLTDNRRLREEFGITHRSVRDGYKSIYEDLRHKGRSGE